MSEKELKLTDLDYAVGSHRLQMMKAALPYMEIGQQRAMSLFIKWNELRRTMDFFEENDDGMMSVCSVDGNRTSAADMLGAIRPYANEREQEQIDMLTRFLKLRESQGGAQGRTGTLHFEQLLSVLPPEQQSRFESMRMMVQAMAQM